MGANNYNLDFPIVVKICHWYLVEESVCLKNSCFDYAQHDTFGVIYTFFDSL